MNEIIKDTIERIFIKHLFSWERLKRNKQVKFISYEKKNLRENKKYSLFSLDKGELKIGIIHTEFVDSYTPDKLFYFLFSRLRMFYTFQNKKIKLHVVYRNCGIETLNKFLYNPVEFRCKLLIGESLHFVRLILPSNFSNIFNFLFPSFYENIFDQSGRIIIEPILTEVPFEFNLLFNPFYIPVKTYTLLNKFLPYESYSTILNFIFKCFIEFHPAVLTYLAKFPLGNFTYSVLSEIRNLTFNYLFDFQPDIKWLKFFLFAFKAHLVSILDRVENITLPLKAFIDFKRKALIEYYITLGEKILPELINDIKKYSLELKLRGLLGSKGMYSLYKLFPDYFLFLFNDEIDLKQVIINFNHKDLQLYNREVFIYKLIRLIIEILVKEARIYPLLDKIQNKEFAAYRLFYLTGWETIGSLCSIYEEIDKFFSMSLAPYKIEKEIIEYIKGLNIYKDAGKEKAALLKDELIRNLKYLIFLKEVIYDGRNKI